MKEKLVSIIVRTKNEERWITQCLKEIYNQSYKNEIVIEGDKGFLYTDKIFSKDSDYMPSIILSNSKKKSKITVQAANHFSFMLESFSQTIRDRSKSSFQRKSILRLFQLIDDIRTTSLTKK